MGLPKDAGRDWGWATFDVTLLFGFIACMIVFYSMQLWMAGLAASAVAIAQSVWTRDSIRNVKSNKKEGRKLE